MTRSENMSRIRSKDTKPEILIRQELWKRGIRYRKNCKDIYGKPDIAFKGKRIAVFCDSEFWHGKEYLEGRTPKSNSGFWIEKFERNIARDKKVNAVLESKGWLVLRFWEKEIKKEVSAVADRIEKTIRG